MKRLPRMACWALALMGMAWGSLSAERAAAQSGMDTEPAMIVSIASVNEQIADMGYLMKGAGFGQFAGMLNIQAKEFLKGVDMERAAGAVVYIDEEQQAPDFVAFVPVTSFQDLVNNVSEFADVEEADGITTITTDDGTVLSAKEHQGYACVTMNAEHLQELPEDPRSLLGDLPDQYNLGARVFAQNIPESMREMALGFIRQGMEQQLEEMPQELQELQRANIEYQMGQMEAFVNETEEIQLGFAIDATAQTIAFEGLMTGQEGSKLARQAAQNAGVQSRFGGFILDNCAFNLAARTKVDPEDIDYAQKMLDQLKSSMVDAIAQEGELEDAEAEAVTNLLGAFFDVLGKTMAGGSFDIGGAGRINENEFNAVMVMEMADPKSLEDAIKKVAPLIESRAEGRVKIQFDASQDDHATYHEFLIAVPESEDEARKMFGENLSVQIGLGDDLAILAVGEGSRELVAEGLGGNAPSDAPMMQFNLFLAPILRFAAKMQQDDTLTTMAEKISESGHDRISVTSEVSDRGVRMRFELQDGFLQLLGLAAQQMGGALGGAEF